MFYGNSVSLDIVHRVIKPFLKFDGSIIFLCWSVEGLAADLIDKLWNGDDLLESVAACDATNPADKEMILKDIRALDGGIDAYDAFVNRLLELNLGCARKFKDVGGIGLDAIRRMQSLEMDMSWAAQKLTSLHELIPDNTAFSTMVQLTSLRIDCGGLLGLMRPYQAS